MEQSLLPLLFDWVPAQRWYRSKSRVLQSLSIEAWAPLDPAGDCVFAVARTVFADGSSELYALPLVLKNEDEARSLPESARIGSVPVGTEKGTRTWCDASREPVFHRALHSLLAGEKKILLGGGVLSGSPLSREAFDANAVGEPSAKLLSAEQSNTAFAYSTGRFAKLYRRLEAAVNPEPETLRFLRRAGYPHVPAFVSSLEWNAEGREPVTVALLQDWVSSRGDAWAYALEQLQAARAEGELPASLLAWSATLGLRVAELHNALGSKGRDASDAPEGAREESSDARAGEESPFAPEPLLPADLARLRAGTLDNLRATLASLERTLPRLAPETAALARAVLSSAPRLEARLAADLEGPLDAMKIRTHGDLHLGQILVSSTDPERVWILDFEGEPGRPLSEARGKHSPVRDAAGMMRSFHYAAHVALRDPALRPLAEEFSAALAHAFREAYFAALRVPVSRNPRSLLEAFMLEKAVYELNYELNNRPDWAEIPLLGLQQLVTDY